MKLDNMAVNDIVTQFNGPQTGVNYGGTNPAYCVVALEAKGVSSPAVKVQYNISPILGYDDTNRILVPDPAQWVDVATISAMGATLQAVTARAGLNWLRVIVSTAGTGTVNAGGQWARRGA